MTIKMTNKARAAAHDLAVCYANWVKTDLYSDPDGVIVWGQSLLRSQELTGIELADPDNTATLIKCARKLTSEGE